MSFASAWMDLDIIILTEESQIKTRYGITYITNLKKDTNELIYRLRDTENKLWLPKGKRRGGGINEEFGINRYTIYG